MIRLGRAAIGIAAALLAGCAGKPDPAPRPMPVVRQAPPPQQPAPEPAPTTARDWIDLPLTPGEWTYVGTPDRSIATYHGPGTTGFTLQCETARRELRLSTDIPDSPMRVHTSFGEHSLPFRSAVPAADPLLDEIVFSRGRFAVEVEGRPMLIVPAWPEPARVIEDCRG